jgi:Delta3-Delta2-enoyl-CoA isomerase
MFPTLSHDGPVWTLVLGDGDNRLSPDWLDAMSEALDTVARSADPAALVTIAEGKIYSNGLDLDWLGAHPDQFGPYVDRVQALFAQVLTLPVPTVAALNGHAFAGGAMLALAHDYRVMRDDRGYVCLPEVDIRIPFSPGMCALIMAKVPSRTAVDAMTTGRRYPAQAALDAGLVDAVTTLEQLPAAAAALVEDLAGKDRATLGAIKSTMFAHVVEALALPVG